MRACTAAGINPCVRTPPPEYIIPCCHSSAAARDFPMGICRWCRLGKGLYLVFARNLSVAPPEKRLLFLVFVWICR